ncbi:unnamed protein product [Schistocephalus solidus]|uniref:Bravo_FIGEY domain-containing protein n=1 Tax=Schistocephalus solidus TaxID=70667 RepID=A0A183SFZ6_SCHSO|nr:unnamed protein product [Schistocephalus solidus]
MTCLIHSQARPYSKEFSVHFNCLKQGYLAGKNTDHSELQSSPSHQDDTQLVKHYLEGPSEGYYEELEAFNDEEQVKKLEEVPPED